MSTDGKVIVGSADAASTVFAVKWSGAGFSPSVLGTGQSFSGNPDGSVIVGTDEFAANATIWDKAGAHAVVDVLSATPDLTSDWSLSDAIGISDDGKFLVGSGEHGGHGEGWVAHLP